MLAFSVIEGVRILNKFGENIIGMKENEITFCFVFIPRNIAPKSPHETYVLEASQ